MPRENNSTELEAWLPGFFAEYQACRAPQVAHVHKQESFRSDFTRLANWFADMEQPIIDSRKGAFHFDPWAVAGLGSDEVRNSAVLAWLLNPKGSHGLGDMALLGLLGELRNFDNRFPLTCSRSCRVRVESNPDGDIGSRVDIEIDDENFYVIIEVKIAAPEGREQMKRYGEIANRLVDPRIPWALVFLTPQGRRSDTAAEYAERVLPMSWRRLSFSLAQSLKDSSSHVSNVKGAARHMAEQSVQRFLQQMRTF